MVGLYNRYSRLRTMVIKFISKLLIFHNFKLFFLKNIDLVLKLLNKNKIYNEDKINAWLRDQYFYPHETHIYMMRF